MEMGIATEIKQHLRPLYTQVFEASPTLRILYLMAKPSTRRCPDFVHEGYSSVWASYSDWLSRADTLEDWLCIPGFDDLPHTYHISGKIERRSFDSNKFQNELIARTLAERFPNARSIAEYGCGVGRNVLSLKKRFPHLDCYGYELCQAGVDVARAAADKFGIDAKYSALDYVNGVPDEYVFPKTDVAFTVFSLEQLPYTNMIGVKNILDHVNLGSIHLEPVSENYPYTYRGILGRIYSHRINYLKNFDAGVRSLRLRDVRKQVIDTAHNPLMYPSLYVLER